MNISVECNTDHFILSHLLKKHDITGQVILHQRGKSGVLNRMKNNRGEIGIIDEDPEARRKIIERIELLEKQAGPDSRAGMWERFEREWAASYGYLTMDMYLLVGPRPLFPPEAGIEIVKSREEDAMDVLDSMSQAP